MAKKNDETRCEMSEATATAVTEKTDEAANTMETVKSPAKSAKSKKFIYIGPSAANGKLQRGTVFNGDINSIKRFLADEIAKYPSAEKLIIPIEELSAAQIKVSQPGNSLFKTFNDTAAAMSAGKKEDLQ